MTERQREEDLLAQLLTAQPGRTPQPAPALSRHDERSLLSAANRVGTPALVPGDAAGSAEQTESFAGEVLGVIKRYPLPAVAFGAGLAFLLTRRRH